MRTKIGSRLLITALGAALLFLPAPQLTAQPRPVPGMPADKSAEAFGTEDYTITTIPGVAFVAGTSGTVYHTSGSLARGVSPAGGQFFATPEIPAGVVIDYMGFNNLNDGTAGVMNLRLWWRNGAGGLVDLISIPNTAHLDWQTDINSSPRALPWNGDAFHGSNTLIVGVEVAPSGGQQFFGSVEIWWRRRISSPIVPTFNDVPFDHPFYAYIEALAASGVTGGCNATPPLFCPNSPVTRGQMAVFLAKALGLHWPG